MTSAAAQPLLERAPARAGHVTWSGSIIQSVQRALRREPELRTVEMGGQTLTLDELGPIVIQEDGRLGRLSNWQEMTEGEQQMTLKFVAKRNAQRRGALLQRQQQEQAAASDHANDDGES